MLTNNPAETKELLLTLRGASDIEELSGNQVLYGVGFHYPLPTQKHEKRMKYLVIIAAIITTALTGCEAEPNFQLKLEAQEASYLRWMSVSNIGEEAVTVRKITINKNYEVTQLTIIYQNFPWEPMTIEMGKSFNVVYPKGCGQPIVVDVETDQGNASYKFE